ncbi:MAG TPA: LLM class flavin-dependent oxidoreductase [Stellaceae bacterium]|nr:LLM class flavin-dependent oxidoreductase [Stellaceae bacterium]
MPSHASRVAMHNGNALKIGLFGANCSSGRAVTLVEERWSGSWSDCLALAQAADAAGIDFMLPIGRWKGYGGEVDYQGATLETMTWASGLLAATKRITIFGTVHAPLFNPLIAAKLFVTADQIGGGRFGLNVVCGWNEGEFDMFGVEQRDHDRRYDYAHEWIHIVKRAWDEPGNWDHKGEFFDLQGVRMNPKPVGGTHPLIMNAGASANGRAFALKNCDAFFTTASRRDLVQAAEKVREIKAEARSYGHEVGVYTVGVVTCRPTRKEAEDYYHYAAVEKADWEAVDNILALKDISPETVGRETYEMRREAYANGMGGVPIVGDPDMVADALADLAQAGLSGIGISFVNYGRELPFFVDEVLPRLERKGLRQPRG